MTLSSVSGSLSGLVIVLVALWLLAQRHAAPRSRLLAYFLATWGGTILLANALTPHAPSSIFVAHQAMILVVPPYLAAFAFTLPRQRMVPVAFFLVSALGALILAAWPERLLGATPIAEGASLQAAPGDLALLLGMVPLYAGLSLAILAFLGEAIRTTMVGDARRARVIAAGLTCFLAAATPWFGIRLLSALPEQIAIQGTLGAALALAMFTGAFLFLVAIGAHIHRAPMTREDRRILALALYAPFLTATAAALVLLAGGPRINPVGFWRIVTVALIVLAVVRHRVLEGEVRFQRTAVAALTVFAGVSLALVAEGTARLLGASALTSAPAALGIGAVFSAGVILPYTPVARRLTRRAFRALVEPHDPSRAQQLEVYRAALEARAARGEPVNRDDPALVQLRSQLHVDARDHELLALFVERRRGPSAPVFEPGARILDGTLTVERVIGAGASARVYEARDETGRAVAVKVQPPLLQGEASTGARAVHEAQILDGLRSSNVLRVVEVADRSEAFYVVTERAHGTLAEKLGSAPAQRLGPAEALRITRDVLTGLAVAHAAGIVHRDVKPANVLLAADGAAVLADFDAATARDDAHASRGTPAWMAPEQFSSGPITPAADVHAAGALLYRMLAGEHYMRVDGLSAPEMRVLITRAEAVIPEEWPAPIRAFLTRALAKEPGARYQDAREALAALPTTWPTP